MTTHAINTQTSLMQIAKDLLEDVKEAGEAQDLLDYANRRAQRRLRVATGSKNPDLEVLRGIADKARIEDVRELGGLLDEMQLVNAG